MEALGAIAVWGALILIVALAVLSILLPYFVWRIAHYTQATYELLRQRETDRQLYRP